MKVQITYKPNEFPAVNAIRASVLALFPFIRQHESDAPDGVKCLYLKTRNKAEREP